jgi:outer membrane protein OmpA-like peptidoglycan-associated protein
MFGGGINHLSSSWKIIWTSNEEVRRMLARESNWAFDTSRSGSVSIGELASVVREGGTVWLNWQPAQTGNPIPYTFDYDAYGVSIGVGTVVQVTFSPKSSLNAGQVYMLDTFVGNDLTPSDLTGFCRFQEISVLGQTATAAFLGIGVADFLKATGVKVSLLNGGLSGALVAGWIKGGEVDWTDLVKTGAKALLLMAGTGIMAGAGAGISDAVGYFQQPWQETAVSKAPRPPNPDDPQRLDTHVERADPDELEIVLDGSNFQTGLDTFTAAAEAKLQEAKNKLAPYRNRFLVVYGYTDNVGHGTYDNQGLSDRRANRVKQWLIKNANRKDSDVIASGRGEDNPVALNDTEAGRAKNRRVEILIMRPNWRPR